MLNGAGGWVKGRMPSKG